MADALQNYIDGKWVDAQDGARFDVFDPSTGEVIATAPNSSQADVDAAVAAARGVPKKVVYQAVLDHLDD